MRNEYPADQDGFAELRTSFLADGGSVHVMIEAEGTRLTFMTASSVMRRIASRIIEACDVADKQMPPPPAGLRPGDWKL